MGKNYIENSLKRFLKRRVKITLGVVVSFLITGAVGFAEGTAEKSEIIVKFEEQQGNYTTAKGNLEGLGAEIFKDNQDIITDKGYSIEVKKSGEEGTTRNIKLTRKDGKTTIDASAINSNAKFSFDDRLVSSTVKTNIENALTGTEAGQGKYQYFTSKSTKDEKMIKYNDGIIIQKDDTYSAQITGEKVDEITNDGIIFGIQSANLNNSKIFNNGIIYMSFDGSDSTVATQQSDRENIEIYNSGLIISNSSGQNATRATKAKLFNNGIISAKKFGQMIGSHSNAYNYGIIDAKYEGQMEGGIDGHSAIENHGTINITEGKYTNNSRNEITSGQNVGQVTSKAYNYGLIKITDGYAMRGAGEKYNYGVIKASEKSEIFGGNGKTINKGIIIGGDSSHLTKYMENSAVFDTDYKLQNTNAKVISGSLSGAELKESVAVIQNNSAVLNGIFNDKTIASVVTEDIQSVFTLGAGETVLNNTNLVGYFENNNGGTLLKVDADKTLTLDGETNITAVKDLQSKTGNVYALSLEEGSTLNLIGSDVKVNGIINGLTNTTINAYAIKGELSVDTNGKLLVGNIQGKIDSEYLKSQNVTDVTISKKNVTQTIKDLEFNFTNTTAKDENGNSKENKVVIADGISIAEKGSFVDKTEADNKVNIIIENLETFAQNLDEIKLGAGENTLQVINNNENYYKGEIDLGIGNNDTFVVYGTENKDNVFNYNVINAETIELNGGTWGDWGNAQGTIGFTGTTQPNLVLGGKTTMNITLNAEGNHGSDFANYVGTKLGLDHATITGTGNVKYLIDEKGLDSEKLTTDKYSFGKDINYKSAIFNIESDSANKKTTVTIKTANEMGLSGQDRIIYDAYIDQIKVGTANKDVIGQINAYNTSEDFAAHIKQTRQQEALLQKI